MKQALLILGFCLTVSGCRTDHSRNFVIDLPNLETQIELPTPTEFDTLLTWKRSSDYTCGDQQYIRVQNSNDAFELEKGWVHVYQPKNINQMTISYPYHDDCHEIPIERQSLIKWIESQIKSEKGISFGFNLNTADSVEIENHKFAYITYEQRDHKIQERTIRKIIYMTFLNNKMVEFEFASNIPDDTTFFKTTKNRFEKMKIKIATD